MTDNTLPEGTDLYHREMQQADADPNQERGLIRRKVWSPTPWMVDVFEGDSEDDIRNWCYHQFGQESSPIHGDTGLWHRGSVTMYWRTWYGFATKEIMDSFLERWPAPPGPSGD